MDASLRKKLEAEHKNIQAARQDCITKIRGMKVDVDIINEEIMEEQHKLVRLDHLSTKIEMELRK